MVVELRTPADHCCRLVLLVSRACPEVAEGAHDLDCRDYPLVGRRFSRDPLCPGCKRPSSTADAAVPRLGHRTRTRYGGRYRALNVHGFGSATANHSRLPGPIWRIVQATLWPRSNRPGETLI